MNNIFGTDGIRGEVGNGFFTPTKLYIIGQAIAQWVLRKYTHPQILLCNDSRESAPWITQALFQGMAHYTEITAWDAGILPTPAACTLLHYTQDFSTAVVISASHNPYQDNGIKIFDKSTLRLSAEDEVTITKLIETIIPRNNREKKIIPQYANGGKKYIEILKSAFPQKFLQRKKIVLDTAHGATSYLAPEIFSYFGATVIPINNSPNGNNINSGCGATNIEPLQKSVAVHQADIGFAFDGDGDRIIAVNKYGSIQDGDDILGYLATYSEYAKEPTIVSTIMCNQGLEKYLAAQNKKLIRASVGEKNVYDQLVTNKVLLGGESCGHIILRNHIPSGDGIYTALKIVETCCKLDDWNIKTFEKFPQVLINVPIDQKKDLSLPPYATCIQEYENKLVDGRLIVRYSGTQNLLRVMVEEKDKDLAQKIAQGLAHTLQEALSI